MAEEKGIRYRSYVNGMSNDDSGSEGTCLFAKNVNIRDDKSKITLSEGFTERLINKRTSNFINLIDVGGGVVLSVSTDGYLEAYTTWRSIYTGFTGYTAFLGPIFKHNATVINAIKANNYLVVASDTKLSRYSIGTDVSDGYGLLDTDNDCLNPELTSNTSWTVGAGWTTGANGAVHTTGNTANLEQAFTSSATHKRRISLNVSMHSGTVSVYWGTTNMGTIDADTTDDLTTAFFVTGIGATDTLSIRPSSTFNGTINYVDVRQVPSTTYDYQDEVTIDSSIQKPMLYSGGDLYIGNGNKVDRIDTKLSSWVIDKTIELPEDENVVDITFVGDSYYIYCSDGNNGILYIWDGTSTIPNERIFRKNLPYIRVENYGNFDYAVCGNGYKVSLYKTLGREKEPIIISGYQPQYGDNKKYTEISQRFKFNPTYPNSMEMVGDLLYVGGPYSIYRYGFTKAGYPSVIDTIRGNTNIWYNPTSINNYGSNLFVGTNISGGNYSMIIKYDLESYTRNGYVVTNPMYWNAQSAQKELEKSHFGYRFTSSGQTINIYACINDDDYITLTVSGITTTPTAGAIYDLYGNTLTITDTNISTGAGTITGRLVGNDKNGFPYAGTITKTSGTGDSSISYTDRDNFVLVKSLTASEYTHGDEYILGSNFVSKYLGSRHKIYFKVELDRTTDIYATPEMYDFYFNANIIKNVE